VHQGVGAVLCHQRFDPLRPETVRRRLRAEVAGDLTGAAEVRADHREEVPVDLAVLHEPHRRDDQPLLVDLARHPDAPRGAAPHVDVVRDVRHVAEERSLVEDGSDQGDVVQVHAAQVRVVDEDAVARGEVIGPVGRDGSRHDVGQRAQVRRLGEGLGDRAQVAVEERAGEIAAGLDVRGVRGAAERRPISSVMASSALRMTSKRTGSTSGARARDGTVEVVMAGSWYRGPPGHGTPFAGHPGGLGKASLRQPIGDASPPSVTTCCHDLGSSRFLRK
jgi:hypothetical protein